MTNGKEIIELIESLFLIKTDHVQNIYCLNCGKEVNYTESDIKEDDLGKHLICPKCESSFNLY